MAFIKAVVIVIVISKEGGRGGSAPMRLRGLRGARTERMRIKK
jgi:hypothetical protein